MRNGRGSGSVTAGSWISVGGGGEHGSKVLKASTYRTFTIRGATVSRAGIAGTFAPAADLGEGDTVASGQVIGRVATRQGPVDVATHEAGVLTEWLAHHDDPVAPGQPLARIGGNLP